MVFKETNLAGAYLVKMEPKSDARGWFSRYFCKKEFEKIGHKKEWVQMNHSFTSEMGTIRGMHYQATPYQEIKLVKCLAGKILDVIIDLRPESPTYLQYAQFELSADTLQMIYIPEGFAHGFQTLSDNVQLIYHHSEFYNPHAEAGIRYNDPLFSIPWPLVPSNVSERDTNFSDFNKNKIENAL